MVVSSRKASLNLVDAKLDVMSINERRVVSLEWPQEIFYL
jgi:hypothetical protein